MPFGVKQHLKQFTLGELIAALDGLPRKTAEVFFDFVHLSPTTLRSYRGYHEDIALGYDAHKAAPTVEALLVELRSAIGKEFEGYKGGKYTMSETTPLWVANYGESGSTIIKGVKDDGPRVILKTKILL